MNIYYDARWTRVDFHDGISRYGAGIMQGFKDNNIPITILIHDKRQLKMLPAGLPYLLVNNPLSVKELFLSSKLNKLGVDVVISPFQIFGSLGRKFKLILTLHDTIYYLHPKPPANVTGAARIVWRLFHMVKWPQRLLLNSADKVATVSKYSKRNIEKLALTKRDIAVIYNAPSLDPAQAHRSKNATKNIIYMGAFMPYKNVEVLIKGMAYLPGDFTLHLLSRIQDERKAELSKLIKPNVNVVFHNGVSDEEYIKLLQGAYCLASASKEEGFGLPIIEAQIIGTPVVCSDMTIFHEVAEDGALFFDYNSPQQFADQVKKLGNAKFVEALVQKGKMQADKFSWKKSAMTLYKVCSDLINNSVTSKKLHEKPKLLYATLTIASAIGFLASFLQMLEKIELLKNPNTALFCNINAVFSCSNILNVWQSAVFGFPNSLMCIVFFVVTLTAGLIGWTNGTISRVLRLVFMGLAWFFVMFGFWYLWQSIFVIGAICIYCLVCYAAVLVISGSWLRLNYHELKLGKNTKRFLDYVVVNNFDIVFWLFIATLIAIEAAVQFAY